jgi:DNA-directed RNA polymerase specialized sigma24 family protein
VDELLRRHASLCWRVAYAVVGRRDLAKDVVQDAFIQAVGALA